MTIEDVKNEIKYFFETEDVSKSDISKKIFKKFSDCSLILESIKDLLKDDDRLSFSYGSNFLCYLINGKGVIPGSFEDEFIELVEEDFEAFEILNKRLYFNDYYIRQAALNSLSSLKYEECFEFLLNSFDHFYKNDVLILPFLIDAVMRMTDDIPWEFIYKLANGSNYIIKWSFFCILNKHFLDNEKTYVLLEKLKKDENGIIKLNAEYFYKKLKYEETSAGYDYDGAHEHYDENEKFYSFEDMAERFMYVLHEENKKDYNLAELEDFIKFYVENEGVEDIGAEYLEFKKRDL